MTRIYRYLLPAVVAGLASAAGTLSGPVAGYVTDASRTQLRTIFGVPGAYRFSDPLELPAGVTQIRLAPGQDFALVETADSDPAVMVLNAGNVDRMTPVAGALRSADWVAFSAGAGSALLYSSAANRLQVLSGLPDSPQIALDMDASTLPEQPSAGAVSDDGSLVLAASATSLYRISGGLKLVLSAGSIRSVAVLRNGTDAAISDASTGSVQIVRNAGSNPETRVLASGIDGIATIVPAYDGQLLFAERPDASAVSSIDLTSGEVKTFATPVTPAGLLPLRNRDTFLISARAQDAGWVFLRDGAGAKVIFIPAEAGNRENPVRGGVR